MPEQPTVLKLPRLLVLLGFVTAVCIAVGLFFRTSPQALADAGLPPGTDLLLLGLGALGFVAYLIQLVRLVRATVAARTSR